ncbi:MAG: hypothetical protein ACRC8D_09300, partial [Aeromonas sp.]
LRIADSDELLLVCRFDLLSVLANEVSGLDGILLVILPACKLCFLISGAMRDDITGSFRSSNRLAVIS